MFTVHFHYLGTELVVMTKYCYALFRTFFFLPKLIFFLGCFFILLHLCFHALIIQCMLDTHIPAPNLIL